MVLDAVTKVEGPKSGAVGLLFKAVGLCEAGLGSQVPVQGQKTLVGQVVDIASCGSVVKTGGDGRSLVSGADDDGVLVYCVMAVFIGACFLLGVIGAGSGARSARACGSIVLSGLAAVSAGSARDQHHEAEKDS